MAFRRAEAATRLDDLERWLQSRLPRISAKTPLAAAIRHALARLERLRPYSIPSSMMRRSVWLVVHNSFAASVMVRQSPCLSAER